MSGCQFMGGGFCSNPIEREGLCHQHLKLSHQIDFLTCLLWLMLMVVIASIVLFVLKIT